MSQKCLQHECGAWATADGYCFMHSPAQDKNRALAQRKGGLVGKDPRDRIGTVLLPITINNAKDVVSLLSETLNLVRLGTLDIKVANCLGNLSNYLLNALDQSDLELRLNEIEIKLQAKDLKYD